MYYEMSDYIQMVSEAYDLSDPYTKKMVLYCNEAQRMTNIEYLTNRLYNHIKAQTDKIDFGSIPASKGDITKIQNYQNLIDCIDIMHKMLIEYNEKTDLVDSITTAMDNIQKRQRIFEKSFILNIDFPVLMYNTIVLSCVSSVSLMIATCVEYVKEGKDSFTMALDKTAYSKSKDHVLFQCINTFNKSCNDGTIDKLFKQCIKSNAVSESTEYIEEGIIDKVKAAYDIYKQVDDGIKTAMPSSGVLRAAYNFAKIVLIAGAAIAAIRLLLVTIKNGLYYLKYFKYKFSDWLSIQADFLQMNADNLQYREDRKGSDEHRDKVRERQYKWVDRLRKLANFVALKDKKAQKDTENEDREDKKPKPYNNEDDSDDGGLF